MGDDKAGVVLRLKDPCYDILPTCVFCEIVADAADIPKARLRAVRVVDVGRRDAPVVPLAVQAGGSVVV